MATGSNAYRNYHFVCTLIIRSTCRPKNLLSIDFRFRGFFSSAQRLVSSSLMATSGGEVLEDSIRYMWSNELKF